MPEIGTAGAKATAYNASIRVGELEAELAEARQQAEQERPFIKVARLEEKVAKQKAHLADAERALAEAKTAAKEGN